MYLMALFPKVILSVFSKETKFQIGNLYPK